MAADYLTTREVADRLGIHPRTVREHALARGVEGRKIGQVWLWPQSILKALAERKVGRPPKS